MEKKLITGICLILVLSFTATGALAQNPSPRLPDVSDLAEHVPGELLIRFSPGTTSTQAANKMADMGVSHKRDISAIRVHLVKLPPGLSVEQAIDRFSHRPGVEFVEPNYILQIEAANQEEITDQWALEKIRAVQAWGTFSEQQKIPITLATVDTGIDPTHNDLASNMWSNSSEIPGNSLDDDNNGYIDDSWGWDFVNNDNDPFDDNMHGTAVSSVMAGDWDGDGVAGICPWCLVMAVKVLGSGGTGTLDVVASGIIYAANSGAEVINLSLAGTAGMQTLEDAVNYAWGLGALVVAGAGNAGTNAPMFPAGYANAMAIGSTGETDYHSCFSNYAENYISVAAPGENILVALPDQGYGIGSGTSLSSPLVAGLGGLLLSQDPDRINSDVRSLIENTAVDLSPEGFDAVFGHGRIDAYRAVTNDQSQVIPPDALFSTSNTATGYAHARKLVRDLAGTLHMIWHTKEGSNYKIRYATSVDDGLSWNLEPDVFSSQLETYHPAIASDGQNLFVAIPSRLDVDQPYQILFTRKSISSGSWSQPESLMGGTYHAIRPDLFFDSTNGWLHLVASSFDDTPYVYYLASGNLGISWDTPVAQVNPSTGTEGQDSKTRYAAIHANGNNIYIVTRTVNSSFFTYYYMHSVRSIDGGQTWFDQTKISSYLAFLTGEYGISLAGVGDQVYMGYEVGGNMYFRHHNGTTWSDYETLELGDSENVYKWPSITQADDGQAWLLFEVNGELYMRHYDGATWAPKELVGLGNYANLRLGTDGNRIDWVATQCNGAPFLVSSDSRTLGTSTNNPPQADTHQVVVDEDTPVSITLTGSDPDGDPLTFSISTGPADGELTGTAPNVVYEPSENFSGADSFTFIVNDGQVDSNPATVSITINPINDPPLAVDDTGTVAEGGTLNEPSPGVLSNDSDPENDPLTVSTTITLPTNGTLILNTNGSYTYIHNGSETTSDSFVYEVCDTGPLCNTATVNLNITPVNDPPLANDDSVTAPEDTTVAITLTGSDPDGDTLTFRVISGPSHGYLSGSPPNLTYTPQNGYSGPDSFTFTVNDGTIDSDPVTVSITVTSLSMHVSDLDSEVTNQPRNRWDAAVSITVHDSAHTPVTDSTVDGSWSAGATGGASCVTDSSGTCSVTKSNLKGNLSSVTFTVDGISHATLTYNSSANHDPDADSDGIVIIVYKDGPPANQPPAASFTYSCNDLSCDFDASGSSDPDSSISSYTWDYGDGNSGSGVTTSHTYGAQSTYTVVLTVVDNEGASSTESQQVFLGNIQSMHVGDLDGSAEPGKRNRWNAHVDILVHSASEETVAGVTASGSWSSGANGSCTTDVGGWCTITLTNIKSNVSSVNFSITDLTAAGWEYDLQSNHDLDGDSNGTSIAIEL